MGGYLGDFAASSTVRDGFSTFDGNGASVTSTMTAASNLRVYKDGGTTERASTSGYTLTKDFDSVTGVVFWSIDTSDNTTVGFYAAGSDYMVVLQGSTIDGQTVSMVLATFSIANRNPRADVVKWNGTAVATPATAGVAEVNVKNINNVATTAVTTVKAVQGLTTADTIATYTGNTVQTGDTYVRVGAAGAGLTALGDTRIANLDASVSSRSTYAGGAVASVTAGVTVSSIDPQAIVASTLSSGACEKIADIAWRRTAANIRASSNGDAPTFRSGLGMMSKLVNKAAMNGTNFEVFDETDAGTPFGVQAVTSSASADPITGLDTV